MIEFAFKTPRLIIRDWRDSDRAPWAAMGRDPEVMANLGPRIDRAQADVLVDRQRAWVRTRRDA